MNGKRARALALTALTMASCGIEGCRHRVQAPSQPPPAAASAAQPAGARHRSSSRDSDGMVAGDVESPGVTGRPSESSGTANGSLATPPSMAIHGQPFETEVGLASWYGPPYAGRRGADGTVYDQNAMTAAHLTLALGTVVRVTNLVNGQSVVVRITDRGPFVRGRIIDLSLAAARATGVYRAGVVRVRVEAFNAPAPKPNVYAGGRWCVQVGAFLTEADAVQEKLDLIQRYPGAKVIEFAGPTGYWVRINPKIADRAHATEVVDAIHLPDAAQPYLTRTD